MDENNRQFRFVIRQEFVIDEKTYDKLYDLIYNNHRIIAFEDINGETHLLDWEFVKHNQIAEIIRGELPL